jgi:hypothetical protein
MFKIIKLNVGGSGYSTNASTLLKYDSIFKDLLESTFDNNEIFIDRNGKLFEYISTYAIFILLAKNIQLFLPTLLGYH